VFKDRPLHDFASHGADAWRYFAVAWRDKKSEGMERPVQMANDWSVF
jgi:hypothetical protein